MNNNKQSSDVAHYQSINRNKGGYPQLEAVWLRDIDYFRSALWALADYAAAADGLVSPPLRSEHLHFAPFLRCVEQMQQAQCAVLRNEHLVFGDETVRQWLQVYRH